MPVDTVNEIVPQLIRNGHIERPGLGIVIWGDQITHQLRSQGIIDRRGVLIRELVKGGAAAKAGLQVTNNQGLGDLIIGIDDEDIQSTNDLFRALQDFHVGDEVTVRIVRNGEIKEVQITLQPLPGFHATSAP